ncbi:MAG: hypothetical protein BWY08_00070 [Bacteroidetes bacterium ADurb.Bin174]|nr:MAG: hypothetical protein BWY08_00070 [Bacteroidetes bacterium ADurb.Bin174]
MFFTGDFYPTPETVIQQMIEGLSIEGKIILEPSAGSGNIVRALQQAGAREVIACENDPQLIKITQSLCRIVERDFLALTSDRVSHIDAIVMNPPFSAGAQHILHAYNIAPAGCKIIALCNLETIKNPYNKSREELKTLVETYGQFQDLGDCFSSAERKTGVNVALIRLDKPGSNYDQEFAGFFMDEDQEEKQENGLMSYNAVRDLVNRYVESIKIYDKQLETAVKLNDLQKDYFDLSDPDDRRGEIAISINQGGVKVARNEFKKRMQRSGWRWIFNKMDLNKTATKGLREDINKFVEKQQSVPFTMKNIYHMLDMVIQTTGQRMDKAILEVFEKVTRHSHDNEHRVEGWKTNSHYLLTKRFIVPGYYKEEMEDMVKALCYITGQNYDDHMSLYQRTEYDYALMTNEGKVLLDYPNTPGYSHCKKVYHAYQTKDIDLSKHPNCKLVPLKWEYGKWFDWGFFQVRKYKKGTIHFEFKDEKVWADFNQRVAKLKGYALPKNKEQTAYQKRQTYTREAQTAHKPMPQKPVILATFKV